MKWLWHLHREWARRARNAEREVARSERELEQSRRDMVPLARWREANHFAQLISDSLLNGGDRR